MSLDPGKLLSSSSPSFSSGVHDVKSSEASLGRVNPPGTKGTSEKTSRSKEASDFLEEASRRASDMLHEEMGASETKGRYAAALEEQTKDAKRSTSQSSRSKSSSAESTSTASLAGHRHPSKGEGSASKSKRGSKASGKHGSKAHAKTASEEIQLSIQDLLHDNEPDVASGRSRATGGRSCSENWAEDEIIVDQRVSRGADAPPAPSSSGCFAYTRARGYFANARKPSRRRRAPTRRRRCPLSERRFATLERLFISAFVSSRLARRTTVRLLRWIRR